LLAFLFLASYCNCAPLFRNNHKPRTFCLCQSDD